ncbi:MAG: glycosyltransferase family 2 protein [Candidatus Marsarchaeota archaeon]
MKAADASSHPADLPEVAVVMLAHGHLEMTVSALTGVINTDYPRYHVLLVDNGSEGGFSTSIKVRFPSVELLSLPVNLGTPAGFNRGLQSAQKIWDPDYFVLMDNDVVISDPRWLKELVGVAVRSGAAAVGPAVVEPSAGKGGRRLYFRGELKYMYFPPYYLFSRFRGPRRMALARVNIPIYYDSLVGACLLLSARALKRVGLYDEGYSPHGLADGDLCFRMWENGESVVYDPRVTVTHFGGATTGKRLVQDVRARTKLARDHWNRFFFFLSLPFFLLPSPQELRQLGFGFGDIPKRVRGVALGLVAPTRVAKFAERNRY